MSFFDKINNSLMVNAIEEILKGRDPEESLPGSGQPRLAELYVVVVCVLRPSQRYRFWVNDDVDVGFAIGDVNATDADGGQFGLIEYAIINDVDDYFHIGPTTVRDDSPGCMALSVGKGFADELGLGRQIRADRYLRR